MAHIQYECVVRMSSYLNDLILILKIFLYVFLQMHVRSNILTVRVCVYV